jgi:hypothetical protein
MEDGTQTRAFSYVDDRSTGLGKAQWTHKHPNKFLILVVMTTVHNECGYINRSNGWWKKIYLKQRHEVKDACIT